MSNGGYNGRQGPSDQAYSMPNSNHPSGRNEIPPYSPSPGPSPAAADGRRYDTTKNYGASDKQYQTHSLDANNDERLHFRDPTLSPSEAECENHIYFVFQNQLELEKNIEKVKIQLSLKTDFNLIDAFRIFNESGTGSASIQDLIHGLKDLGLQVNNDEITLFMARFDQDHDRQLRYSEFCQAFLPQDSFHASLLAKKAPLTMYPQSLVPKEQIFYPETTELFLQAWTTHLQNEIQAE